MHTNCGNCGAALSLENYSDRLVCAYCETIHLPSLREDAQIEKLHGLKSNTDCPVCLVALSHARIDRWPLLICYGCRGLLMESEAFLNLVLYRRQLATEPYLEPEPIDPRELQRTIGCPGCTSDMTAHPYYGPGNFVIDSCSACKNVWLDASELAKAIQSKWSGSLWQ